MVVRNSRVGGLLCEDLAQHGVVFAVGFDKLLNRNIRVRIDVVHKIRVLLRQRKKRVCESHAADGPAGILSGHLGTCLMRKRDLEANNTT